jgi:glutamine synthetase
MLDGIKYASEKNSSFLFNQLSKKYGDDSDYLEKNREYLTNKNVFNDYKQNEREKLFEKPPYTVWEIIRILNEKNITIYNGSPFSEIIIKSFSSGVLNKWLIQIKEKEIPAIRATIISFKRFQSYEDKDDRIMWNSIDSLINEIAKNSPKRDSIICNLEKAIETKKYETISRIFILLQSKMSELQKMYKLYRKNIIA